MSVADLRKMNISLYGWPAAKLLREAFATDEKLPLKLDESKFEMTVQSLALVDGDKDKWLVGGLLQDGGDQASSEQVKFTMTFHIDTRKGELQIASE